MYLSLFFFFKQKTAYEVRISDWSSDVCSSDLDQILVMLHPFMPFVTEELWHAMGERSGELIVAHWPQPDTHVLDRTASEEIDWLIRLVSGVRTARAELNVPPGAKMVAHVRDASEGTRERM